MKKSVRLSVQGSVQGFFYKEHIKKEAEKLKIKGFVRLKEDGKLEIFIEGNPEEVNKMIDICKQGHQHANIRSVDIKPEIFQDFKDFKVINF